MNAEDPRPITAVLHSIVGNVEALVQAEIGLAKLEARETLRAVLRTAGRGIVGVALGQLALGFLLLGLAELLGTRIPPWAAAMIVGAVVGVAAIVFIRQAASEAVHIHTGSPIAAGSLAHQEGLQHV